MESNRFNALDQCLRHLATAVSTASLYGVAHQQVVQLCETAHACLAEAMGEEPALSLVRVDDQLAVGEQPLPGSLYVKRFGRLMKVHGIGHVKFIDTIKAVELHRFVAALAERGNAVHSSENVRLGQVEVRYRAAAVEGRFKLPRNTALVLDEVSSEELARIMEVYEAVKHNRNLHVVGLSEIVAEFIDIFASYADPMLALVPLRSMDEYTFTHSLNVCLLNLAQATTLGIEGALLHDIGLSAMLHDVGKLFVPEEVLNKPGALDEREWQLMHQHPVKGAEYLLKSPGVPRMAVLNAYEHHMHFNMSGYPKITGRWEQNLCSQMTTISDVYDSLRTRRPYREPVELETVLGIIEKLAGSQLHPLLTDNFLRLMRRVSPDSPEVAAG